MRLSVNEVLTMCQRAGAGAGLPFGLAEDCAAAAAWLTTAGFDGVEVFRRALDGMLAERTGSVKPVVDGDRYCLAPAAAGRGSSALFAGPALSDRMRVHAIAGGAPLAALAVDEPMLVLACVVIAGGRAAPFTVGWRQCEARCGDGGCSVWGIDGERLDTPGPVDVLVELGRGTGGRELHCRLAARDIEEAARRCHDQGVVIATGAYQRVNAWARKMLVADSHHSRLAGAGAGLRDND